LFKNAVPEYRELSDYKALFDEEIIEALGDLGERTISVLATFKVEYVDIDVQFRSGRGYPTERVGAFFVLPIVYVFALDENFEDLQNKKA